MEGSVFVEKGGETGIIQQYRKDPQSFVITPPERPSTTVAREDGRDSERGETGATLCQPRGGSYSCRYERYPREGYHRGSRGQERFVLRPRYAQIQLGRNVKDRRIIGCRV